MTRFKGIKNLEAIDLGLVSMEAALIKNQMIKLGMNNIMVIGNDGILSDTFNKTAGVAAEGTVCTGFSNPRDSEEGKEMIEDYRKAGYRESLHDQTTSLAYDSTNIILEAIKKVGLDDKKAMAKEIRNIKFKGIIGETAFDEFGQNMFGGVLIFVSQDGNWRGWEGSDYEIGKKKLLKK